MPSTLTYPKLARTSQQFVSFFGQLQFMVALQVAFDYSQMPALLQVIRNLDGHLDWDLQLVD
jgi:hypothetical protein